MDFINQIPVSLLFVIGLIMFAYAYWQVFTTKHIEIYLCILAFQMINIGIAIVGFEILQVELNQQLAKLIFAAGLLLAVITLASGLYLQHKVINTSIIKKAKAIITVELLIVVGIMLLATGAWFWRNH